MAVRSRQKTRMASQKGPLTALSRRLRGWFPVGTRSVLLGAHCFFIHPFFVALAWYKLWGFKEVSDCYVTTSLKNWKLWLAFFTHDLGYWGSPNIDGPQGEAHPFWGASILSAKVERDEYDMYGFLLDPHRGQTVEEPIMWNLEGRPIGWMGYDLGPWGLFALYHSRFLSKQYNAQYSALCVADKLATSLEPWWLYLPKATLTGEIKEYMKGGEDAAQGKGKYAGEPHAADAKRGNYRNRRDWHRRMTSYMERWAYEHRDLKCDNWTPQRVNP